MPIRACSALLELQLEGQTEPFFEFGSAFNIAQNGGSEAINVVPDNAEAFIDIRHLKAAPRFELGVEVLQTSALPLGDAAAL